MNTKLLFKICCGMSFLISCHLHGLIMEFLQELNALSEFNATMRSKVYEATLEAWNEQVNPQQVKEAKQTVRGAELNPHTTFTFKDLAGDIPEDIREIVDFIENGERFARMGASMPRGILLYGPPGTGKTSIARAIAGEAGAEFFSVSGSDFVEVYVGVGPQRVRELFEKARACPKAIVFIDEIDAIGRKRSGEQNSEYRNTLNALLKELDGFEQHNNVLVIAATNTMNELDDALLRSGRFDRKVRIDLPNLQSRKQIFRLYIRRIAYFGSDEIYNDLALGSEGLSGADIKNIINEAAVLAVRERSDEVTADHLKRALRKEMQYKRSQQQKR